jgi:hypothetical protein
LIEHLKSRYSEKQKMEKLCRDLINKSRLIKSSSQITISFSPTRAQKIFDFAIRGGFDKIDENDLYQMS